MNHGRIPQRLFRSDSSLSKRHRSLGRSCIMSSCWQRATRGWAQISTSPKEPHNPIILMAREEAAGWAESQPGWIRNWMVASNLLPPKPDAVIIVPNSETGVEAIIQFCDMPVSMWAGAKLAASLPPGAFSLPASLEAGQVHQLTLGWILGHYTFDALKQKTRVNREGPMLVLPEQCQWDAAAELGRAIYWVRDLVTTPAEQLGPAELAAEAAALAAHHGAHCHMTRGDELLASNYPAIHTVGRASCRPPVLVDIRWQPPGLSAEAAAQLPLVALVGKGVCFDTGGLNIKTGTSMQLMKKDMGGAALVLGLAHLVMAAGLPVRLRLLVPAVENSIDGSAFRPLDVLRTRAGITVENMNTDAEGRLILADALWDAASEAPDLLLDAATLTGAARQSLGAEVQALFCNDDAEAEALMEAGEQEMRTVSMNSRLLIGDVVLEPVMGRHGDLLWRLPLERRYRKLLDSKVADIKSTGGEGTPGAVMAALFLQEFVAGARCWMHLDTSAWTQAAFSGPGRPEGGEAQALRALWRYLRTKYSAASQPAAADAQH